MVSRAARLLIALLEPDGALLQGIDDNLYGTTKSGGAYGYGTAFVLIPPASAGDAWMETVIHNFGDPNITVDGKNPQSALVQDTSGNLYGTPVNGGMPAGAMSSCSRPK